MIMKVLADGGESFVKEVGKEVVKKAASKAAESVGQWMGEKLGELGDRLIDGDEAIDEEVCDDDGE